MEGTGQCYIFALFGFPFLRSNTQATAVEVFICFGFFSPVFCLSSILAFAWGIFGVWFLGGM
jgi:hypothetical protein